MWTGGLADYGDDRSRKRTGPDPEGLVEPIEVGGHVVEPMVLAGPGSVRVRGLHRSAVAH